MCLLLRRCCPIGRLWAYKGLWGLQITNQPKQVACPSRDCSGAARSQASFDNQAADSELRAAVAAVVQVPTAAVQREEAALLLGKKLLVRMLGGALPPRHLKILILPLLALSDFALVMIAC